MDQPIAIAPYSSALAAIMKYFQILAFLLTALNSPAQKELIDTSVYYHSTLRHFNDCQQYSLDTIKNVESKRSTASKRIYKRRINV